MEEYKIFQTPATITKVTTMRDRTFRIQVDTQEMNPDLSAKLMCFYDSFGVFAFSESEIDETQIEVPKYAKIEKNDKTPSERLRAVLYKFWEKYMKNENIITSDDYYRKKMEEIINHFKKQLNNY